MIVLVGFMGAGKTTVGRLVADALGLPFVDADAAIEAAVERSIPEIFIASGEGGFRALEAEVITGLLAGPAAVLALGGGALGSESVRSALAGHRVVLLDVSLEEALARVGGDPTRPMLQRTDLPELYAGRQRAYRDAADLVVPAGGREPAAVAEQVLAALTPTTGPCGASEDGPVPAP